MKSPTTRPLTFCLALLLATPALASSTASGNFTVRDKTYTVADAVTWHGEHGIHILFSEKKLDAPQLLSDFALDVNDQFNLDHASLRITIYKTDGSSYALGFQNPDGSGGNSLCDNGKHLKIERLDDTSIAGRFACEENDVSFDLPLNKQRPGSPLGEGGGEPGKVLLKRAAALAANDFDAFLAICSPREAEKAVASKAAGAEALASRFSFLSRITPADVQVLGGTQVEDRAWLDFTNPDRSVSGHMRLIRESGRWLVDEVNIRQ
jgi:hypothetical protein